MPDSLNRSSRLLYMSALIAACILGCVCSAQPEPDFEAYCSMVALLSDPDRFDGKVIQTEGVLLIAFESDSIWLSREHLEAGVIANAIGISPPYDDEKRYAEMRGLSGKYVLIEGRFHKGNPHEIGTPRGTIDEITKLFSPGGEVP